MDRFPRIFGITRRSRELQHEHDRTPSGSRARKQRVVHVLRVLRPSLSRVIAPFDPPSDQPVQAAASSTRTRIGTLCAGASPTGPFERRAIEQSRIVVPADRAMTIK